ncbi:MAG: NAD(P)/FAD-dependent oxidoreductase [Saprospiraceae bacterium]|nr:NAD(P)/FAD-dependent oxidoreductase [Saprospiraceae bacterium]
MKIIIIGGGAAGFFAAITAAETHPNADITILERGKDVLQKVKISGGGRCNVTHACFLPRELVKNYPRGEKALMGPFTRFSAGDTIDWFEKRGVQLKIEDDGRMFPTTNNSQTIVDCLEKAAAQAGVKILRGYRMEDLEQIDNQWLIKTNRQNFTADKVLVAAGSSTSVWAILTKLGHTIVQPVPSLFTFNIKDGRIDGLAGLSVPNATVQVQQSKLKTSGPLLITHWGMSGPAILKLSAWGARELYDLDYQFNIRINWTGQWNTEEVKETLTQDIKPQNLKKLAVKTPQYQMATRLWSRFLEAANIPETATWADVSKKQIQTLAEQLTQSVFTVKGKSTFKDEFVTAGGVKLDEVNFKTFESKLFPNLYFAGETLDIDAITGGFNFQAAWTGGWIAGQAMANGA